MNIDNLMRPVRAIVAATGLSLCTLAASAATVTIVENDPPGTGFKDLTPVAALPGNTATTLGAQRLKVANAAADAWAAVLTSSVPIIVEVTFSSLPCNASNGVIGAAGPWTSGRDWPTVPRPGTWYVIALANALIGSDQDPANPDIGATFNADVDKGDACLAGTTWWYGIGSPPVAGTIDFFGTLLHELGHGLGFLSQVDTGGIGGNPPTGDKMLGFDDTFMVNLIDHSTGIKWPAMTSQQRLDSSTNTDNLHWTGPNATANSGVLTAGTVGSHIRMFAPDPVQPGSSVSHWDITLFPDELMEPTITPTMADSVTWQLMKDIGWTISGSVTNGGVVPPPVTGKNVISVTNGFIKLDTISAKGGVPDADDCKSADHYGRMIHDQTTGALWLCWSGGWTAK